MQRLRWTKARIAGVVGGVVLAGSTLALGGLASAQSPSPTPTATPSPSSSPSPATSSSPDDGIGFGRGEFARRLAEALGIPQSRVEDALEQLRDRVHTGAQDAPAQGGRLADAADKLGVTEQQLTDAVHKARDSIRDQAQSGQGGQDRQGWGDAFFSAVAQQLGGGITAEQVRDALGDTARHRMPDRAQLQARADEFHQEFANLLGVTVDQLREALRSIGDEMMHGRRGR